MNFLRFAACTVVLFTFANPVFAQEAAPVETARVEASAPDGAQTAGIDFSLDDKLAEEFDAWIAERSYPNRSEAVRDLFR